MNETARLIIRVDSDGVQEAGKRIGWMHHESRRAERATDGLTSAFKRLLLPLLSVTAAIQGLRKATEIVGGFEESMDKVAAVTQATDEQLQSLTATARRLGADTRYSASQAAEGMSFLGMAGFRTDQIIAAMPGTLDLATAGALGLAEAADIASNILSGFNLSADEATRTADVLATAAANANTNVFQMGDGMKYVAPIAASMGKSMEETAAAIGILSNAGLQGSMAGTGLRQVLSSLASPTKEAADILRAYGIQLEEVNPATHSLSQVIHRLAGAGLTAGDALQIFGDRGAPALLALTSQVGGFDALEAKINNSAGAAKRMAGVMGDNLRGDIKELESAVEELVLKMGDAGLLQALRDGTVATTDFVRAINDMVESGEMAAWADLVMSKFGLIDDGFHNLAENIIALWTMAMDWLTGDGESTVKGLIDIFVLLPENLRAVAQGMGASFGLMVEYAVAAGKGIYEGIVAWFDYLIDTARNVGKEIMSHLDPRASDFDYGQAQAQAFEKFASTIGGSWDTVTQKVGFATQAWEEQIVAIMDEWDANTAASDDKLRRIDELRAAYAKLREARKAAEDTPKAPPVGSPTAPEGQGRFQTREFDQLKKQLQAEEKTVEESYLRRQELILRNTEEGSDAQIELMQELELRYGTELLAAREATAARLDEQYQAKQAELQGQLDQRLITEADFQAQSRANWAEYTNALGAITTVGARKVSVTQMEMLSTVLGYAGDISSQLSALVGENNDAAKAMFIAAKAIAIAQAIVYTELAAARALAEGGVFLGVPMATLIKGLGYASVAIMAATAVQEYSGKFEHGGMIPSGSVGLVGEAGPELIRGPAVVTSARTTADMGRGKPEAGGNVTVNVINQAGAEVETQERATAEGKVIDVIVRRVKREFARDVRTGGNETSMTLEGTYGLRRGAA
jgi:TP901 family phage tail tape measure protein